MTTRRSAHVRRAGARLRSERAIEPQRRDQLRRLGRYVPGSEHDR